MINDCQCHMDVVWHLLSTSLGTAMTDLADRIKSRDARTQFWGRIHSKNTILGLLERPIVGVRDFARQNAFRCDKIQTFY